MKMERFLLILLSAAVTLASWAGVELILAGEPPAGEDEAAYIVITQWNDDCEGSRRRLWDNMVKRWYDDITDGRDAWARSSGRKNGDIQNRDFADNDLVFWGTDWQEGRLDAEDAIMVGLHGGEQDGSLAWYGRVRVDGSTLDGDDDCNAEQDDVEDDDVNEVDLDFDAEFVHLSSCHSMCQDNWSDWIISMHHVHQIDGFHGLMYIDDSLIDDYGDFAEDSFDIPIAEAWLDQLYKSNISSDCVEKWGPFCLDHVYYDQCPVAMGAGNSESDLWNRMDHERYNNVFDSDPTDPDTWGWIWIGRCDPDCDPPLPDE